MGDSANVRADQDVWTLMALFDLREKADSGLPEFMSVGLRLCWIKRYHHMRLKSGRAHADA
jgi:hypothetical protein